MTDDITPRTAPAALKTSGITLPRDVAASIIAGARNASTVAALSGQEPMLFRDNSYIVFTDSGEAQVLGEGATHTATATAPASKTATRFKVQTTTRVSRDSLYADEDSALDLVKNIQSVQSAAVGRAIDYIVYHGVDPSTGTPLTGFTALTASSGGATVVTASTKAGDDFDKLTSAVIDDYDINGVAMARSFANSLRVLRTTGGAKVYPEIPLTLQPGTVDGIKAATSNTVNGKAITPASGVEAIIGDFNMIRYGILRDVTTEVIEYGSPDGGPDLKSVGEVAIRTATQIAVAILDPRAFAILKSK